jgi:hypothetical protein
MALSLLPDSPHRERGYEELRHPAANPIWPDDRQRGRHQAIRLRIDPDDDFALITPLRVAVNILRGDGDRERHVSRPSPSLNAAADNDRIPSDESRAPRVLIHRRADSHENLVLDVRGPARKSSWA